MAHRSSHWPKAKLRFTIAVALTAQTAFDTSVSAAPQGAAVVSGQVEIANPSSTLTEIKASHGAIINWKQFSIGTGETTRFIQPSSSSAVLNRVVGGSVSQILGQLQANGKVFLINPNGILIGAGARIDTNSFIASTLDIADADFQAGRLKFFATPTSGSIKNQGIITAGPGGSVALIAPNIENSGIIQSPDGKLLLAAGHKLEIASADLDNVTFEIQAPSDSVLNLGQLLADNGAIRVFAGLLSQSGEIRANRLVEDVDGSIRLIASDAITLAEGSSTRADGISGGSITIQSTQGATHVAGTVSAQGTENQGGRIAILGEKVAVESTARIDASGQRGGGTILAGGDYQGRSPDVQNAQRVYVGEHAFLRADAEDNGNGGRIIIWSDENTIYYGGLSVRGGQNGGHGGFAEVSGKQNLQFSGTADLSAPYGDEGTLLLDPLDIIVATTGGVLTTVVDEFSDFPTNIITISPAALNAVGGSVVLQAARDIYFNNAVSLTAAGAGLTATAGGASFNAGQIYLTQGISTNGGAVSLKGAGITGSGAISTAGGAVNLQSSGGLYYSGAVNAGAGSITATGATSVSSGNYTSTGNVALNATSGSISSNTVNGGTVSLNAYSSIYQTINASTRIDAQSSHSYVQLFNSGSQPLKLGTINGNSGVYLYSTGGMQQVSGGGITGPSVHLDGQNATAALGTNSAPLIVASPSVELVNLGAAAHVALSGSPTLTYLNLQGKLAALAATTLTGAANLSSFSLSSGSSVLNGSFVSTGGFGSGFTLNVTDAGLNIPTLTMPGAPVTLTAGGGGITLATTNTGSLTAYAEGPISATSLTTTAGNIYLNAGKCTFYYALCTDNSPITIGSLTASGSISLYNTDNGNIDLTSMTAGSSINVQAGTNYFNYSPSYGYHRTTNAINIGAASGSSVSLTNNGTGNITASGNLTATSSSLSVNAQVGAASATGSHTSASSASFTAGNGALALGTIATTNGNISGSATGNITFQALSASGSTRSVTLNTSGGSIKTTIDNTAADITATGDVTLSASSDVGDVAFTNPLDIAAGSTRSVSLTSATGNAGATGKTVNIDTNGAITVSAGGQFHIAAKDTAGTAKTVKSIDLSASASGIGNGGTATFTSQDLSVSATSNGTAITIGDIVQSASTLDKFAFSAMGVSDLGFGNVDLTTAGFNQVLLSAGGALTQTAPVTTNNINAGYINLDAAGNVTTGNVTSSNAVGNRIEINGNNITTGDLNALAINVSGADLSLGSVTSTGTHRGYYTGYDYVPRLGYYQYVTEETNLTATGSLTTSGNIASATSAFATAGNGITVAGGSGTITGGHTTICCTYYSDTVTAAAGTGTLDTGAISAYNVNASGNALNTGNLTADYNLIVSGTTLTTGNMATTNGSLTLSGTTFSTGNLSAANTLDITAASGYTPGAITLAGNTLNIRATTGNINLTGATSVTAPAVTLNAPGTIQANLTSTTGLNITAGNSFTVASTASLGYANVNAKGDQLGTSSITAASQTLNYTTSGSTAALSFTSTPAITATYTETADTVTGIDVAATLGNGSNLQVSGRSANLTASNISSSGSTVQLSTAGNVDLTSVSSGSGWISATSTGGNVTLTSVTTNGGSVAANASNNVYVNSVVTTGANVSLTANTGSILKTGASAVQIDTANGSGAPSGQVSLSAANGTAGVSGTPITISKAIGLAVAAMNDIAIDMNNTTLTDLSITTGASGSGTISIANNPNYAGFSLTRAGGTELLLGPVQPATTSDFRLYATIGDIRIGGDISVNSLYLNAQDATADLIIGASGGPRSITAPYQSDLRAGRDILITAGSATGEDISVQTGYSNVFAGRDIKVLGDGGSALLAMTNNTSQTLSAGRDIRIVGGSQGITGASAAVTSLGGQQLYARQSDGTGSLLIQGGLSNGASASAQSAYSQTVVANNVSVLGGAGSGASAGMTNAGLNMVNTYGGLTVQGGSGANAFAEISSTGSQSIGNQNTYYYNPTDFILVQGGTNTGAYASIRATGYQSLSAIGDISVIGGSGSGADAEIYSSASGQSIGSTGAYWTTATQNILVQAGSGGTARVQAASSQSIMAGGNISVIGGTGANMTASIESTGGSQDIGDTYIYYNDPTANITVQGGTASGSAAWIKAASGQSMDAGQNITVTGGTTGAYAEVSTTSGSQTIGNLNSYYYDQTNAISLTGGTGNNAYARIATGAGSQSISGSGAITLSGGSGDQAEAAITATTGQSVTTTSTLAITGGSATSSASNESGIRNTTSGSQTIAATGVITVTGGGNGSDTWIRQDSSGTQTITGASLGVVASASGGGNSTTSVTAGGDQSVVLNGGAGTATLTVANYSGASGTLAKLSAAGNQNITMPFAAAGRMQVGATTTLGASLVSAGGDQTLVVGDLLVQGGQTAAASSKVQVVGNQTVNSLAGPIQVLGGSAGSASIDPVNLNIISNTGVSVVGGSSSTATASILAGNINIGATNGNVLVTGNSGSAGITATGFLNIYGSGNLLITGGASLTAASSSTIALNGYCTGCSTGLFGPFNLSTGSIASSLLSSIASTSSVSDQLTADLLALLDSLNNSLEYDLFASADEDPFYKKLPRQCS